MHQFASFGNTIFKNAGVWDWDGAGVTVEENCLYGQIKNGIDVVGLLAKLGVGESILQSKAVAGAGTFALAYAVHKIFAPVRIGITLSCAPLLVMYLRRIGFLKTPKVKP